MLRRRRHAAIAVVVGAVVLTGVGVSAGSVIKSPQQAAADVGPPAPDTLTAPVEHRVLTDTVVTRGQVTSGHTVDVAPAGPAGAEAGLAVVTKIMAEAGGAVEPATVLLEVSGRPVFALRGTLPVYRDLKPGAQGDDVRQLQEALAGVGFGTAADTPGTYGEGTTSAVRALYAALGYDPVSAEPDGEQRVRDAERAVRDAERAVEDAAPGTGRTRAAEDLGAAREALAAARRAAGPMVPTSELVYLPGFPARVDALNARVGGPAGERLLTLSAGELVVEGTLGAHEKGLVRKGQKVELFSETTGRTATGTVASVAAQLTVPGEQPSEEGAGAALTQGGAGYAFVVEPDKALPAELAHENVRLTVQAASSTGKVLVVPLSAVSAGADSRTSVTVREAGGRQRRVEVRPGISGDGYVEVTPVGDGELRADDQVIVGVSPGAAAPVPAPDGAGHPADPAPGPGTAR
ncbi:peptidoglycan-binding protein [Streptomyces sp. TRM 70351]|uniref:peptidoglycan-binding protein n=1 Tax=Streptomyces sp. TRM 70351 TaxID=3116552 RepID=UPI002E7BFCC3|nr:peptidoglycan-binding protein [Streptomyces sp. TRM 70351]MEE1927531.1 peptidoglycan-binding protein [Streptomyces sp. TRM 70351]